MKALATTIKWTTAAALLAAMTSAPALAEKTTPATDKNSAVRPYRGPFRISFRITSSIRPKANSSTSTN